MSSGIWKNSKIPYIIKTVAPTGTDNSYGVPTICVDSVTDKTYILVDVTAGTATWKEIPEAGVTAPAIHAPSHTDGTDDIRSATNALKGVATAAQITKLEGIATGAIANVVEDTTPQLYADLDAQCHSLVACQSIANLAAQGPAYYLDGVNNYINLDLLAAELANTNNTEGAIVWKGKIHDFTTDYTKLWAFADTNSQAMLSFGVSNVDYKLSGYCSDGVTLQWHFDSTNTLDEDTEYEIVLTHDGTSPILYINGKVEPITFLTDTDKTIWFADNTGIDNARGGCDNKNSDGNQRFLKCTINKFYALNACPTANEVIEMYEGGNVPFTWTGADMTAQTSGTLIIGKAYRIVDWITNDDFTNVGGTNVDGTEFVATGTTPTTWTNSSSVIQIGVVGQLDQSGIGHNQFLDNSGNELHGTNSGVLTTNLPANHIERFRHTVAITDDTTFTDIVPAGYMLESVTFLSANANACILDLGLTAGTDTVFSQQTIDGSGLTVIMINKVFSMTAAQSLYLNDDGTGTWNGASLTSTFMMKRLV